MAALHRSSLTLAMSIVIAGCCGGGGQHATEVATLASACSGVGVPAAPAYTRGPGEHPIMALRQAVSGRWSQAFGMLTTRTPGGSGLATTQLLLCIDQPRKVELERCAFDTQLRVGFVPVPSVHTEGPSFPRVRVEQRVRVVVARTAAVLGETVLRGSEPPACNRSIVGHPSDRDFRGADITDHAINVWAEPYGLGTAP